mmetsp:Transcript_3093/g.3663  ORF Transcript_3093/g.3663 Transcript_3093/m.3663 type:complete len:618 (+) Transcript_3093:85-1938(+)
MMKSKRLSLKKLLGRQLLVMTLITILLSRATAGFSNLVINNSVTVRLNNSFIKIIQQKYCRRSTMVSSLSGDAAVAIIAEATDHLTSIVEHINPSATTDTNTSRQKNPPPRISQIHKRFIATPFDYHQELTIEIDSLTNMGWGIGRVSLQHNKSDDDDDDDDDVDDKKKWVVMVPHVLVGEIVRVRIFHNMKKHSEADLIEVVTASPERVQPKCSLAGICGGCQYQHMSINAQREWKTKHVEEVLLQQNITNYNTPEQLLVLPTVGTDEAYGYRSKITPHYQAPMEVGDGTFQMREIGFQRSSNRNLVDVPECPIAMPAINEKYIETRIRLFDEAQRGLLNQKPKKKKKRKRRGSKNKGGATGATLLFRQADNNEESKEDTDNSHSSGNGNTVVVTDHNQYMTTTIKNIKFRYLAGNFFQNNNYVVPLMVDAVVEAATAPIVSTGKSSPSYLIDCYCGSGLFALSAASSFNLCVGIELNNKAVEEATANAELNKITNCQFMAASAEAIFTSPPEITISGFQQQRVQTFPRQETTVIVDPPRKGCSEEFLKQLYEYSPQRIIYMSCGPATQARDAKGIVEVGGYDIVSIQPFDLFPQTKHVECLMIFEKKEKSELEQT